MNQVIAGLLDRLEKQQLPVLKETREEFRRLISSDSLPLGDLATLIEHDMGMGLTLMRFVSKKPRGKRPRVPNTIHHALMMLGIDQLKQLGDEMTLVSSLPKEQQALVRSFYCEAHHAAHLGRRLAERRGDAEPNEIFAASLLRNMGELLLWLLSGSEMEKLRHMLSSGEMEKEQAEYVVLGFSIIELTRELAKRWNLPQLYRESLYPENSTNPRIRTIWLTTQTARQARKSWYGEEMATALEELAEHLHLSTDETHAVVHTMSAEAARVAPSFGSRPAIVNLISGNREPQPTPIVAPVVARSAESDSSASAPQPSTELHKESGRFCLMPQPRLVAATLSQLKRQAAGTEPKTTIVATMKALHDGVGMNRVVFALLTSDHKQLRSRSIVGVDNDPVFTQFAIELKRNPLFARLLEKPQAVWIDDNNRNKFWRAIADEFKRTIGINRFFAMSLFIKDKPAGLFYVDRAHVDCGLDARSYKHFRLLVSQASSCLSSGQGNK